MAVHDRASYTDRRFEEIARALREAPPGYRVELSGRDLARLAPGGPPNDAWLAIWDAAEAYVAGRAIEREYPGPAIVLLLSAINRFLSGGDTEARESIDRATKLLKASPLWQDPDVRRLRELAIQRAGFARVSGYLRQQIEEALVAAGCPSERAKQLAKETAEAGNQTRHQAKVTGSYPAMIVQRDDGHLLLGVTAEHIKQGLEVSLHEVIGNVVLHRFEKFVEPACLGAAYTIAQRAAAVGVGSPG